MGFYQAQKIEKLEARIGELEALLSQTNEGYAECIATREDYRARIAELEAELRDSHSAHENRVLYLMKLINDISEQLSDYRKKLTNYKALLYSSDRAALGEKE